MKSSFTASYSLLNYLHSLILLVGMLMLLSLIGWLLFGPIGILWFFIVWLALMIGLTHIPSHYILMLKGARVLNFDEVPYLYEILYGLTKQAGIKNIPLLYFLPDRLMTIFTTGLSDDSAIALSDDIVQQLNTRELTAVLAHEIGHIIGNDLLVKMLAGVISQLTSVMALTGSILILVYIPLYVMTDEKIPWTVLIVMMMAPTVSILIQLALSRSREFRADLEAVRLTGDPLSLASALVKIESYQWNWIERMLMPVRRIHVPMLLRTHPLIADRVNRLKELSVQMHSS